MLRILLWKQGSVSLGLQQRAPYKVEYRLRAKSGDYLWFLARGQAIWNSEGKAIRMSGSVQDITERVKLEDELRKHREHLEQLVAERTDELAKVNVILKTEITERKQAEDLVRLRRTEKEETDHKINELKIELSQLEVRQQDLI